MLTKKCWLTQRENVVFGPKRKCGVKWWLLKCWVVVAYLGKKTCQSFNLNFTKVYELRRILWITGAYAPYSKVLKTKIGIIHLILLRCLRIVVHNLHHDQQVLKKNLFVVLEGWSSDLVLMSGVFKALSTKLDLTMTWMVWCKCKGLNSIKWSRDLWSRNWIWVLWD